MDGSSRPMIRGASRTEGVALPGVLLLAAFLVGVTGWLIGHARSDLEMATSLHEEDTLARVAGAALQSVALALGQVADWQDVGGLALVLACPAPSTGVAAIDVATEGAWLQAVMDGTSRWGTDTPQWRPLWACHGSGLFGVWLSRESAPAVVVWVADDPEGDGLPLRNTNERLLLCAVSRGRGSARGMASATIARRLPGAPVTLSAYRGPPLS